MSSLKKIICLANSSKLQERCIAGIDLNSGKWIRPVCDNLYPEDGRVPRSVRLVDGEEPKLLDILEIPLADTGKNFDFECENLSILPGGWKCLGRVKPTDVIKYCSNYTSILHNSMKYVYPSYLQSLSFSDRRTLQLVYVTRFSIQPIENAGWRGTLQTASGQILQNAKITDPVFVSKLEAGYQPTNHCLVTISLGMPWGHLDWQGEKPCWKLIAGVIEL